MEHDEQAAFIDYCRWKGYLERYVIAAIPNGAKLPWFRNKKGQRVAPQAKKLLREGLLPGFPDVGCFIPKGKTAGMFLEFKYAKNKCSDEQLKIHKLLRSAGYTVVVVWSSEEAINALERYLNG